MENYLKRDLDDILFEHRNKAYGAYALRKSYGKHIQKATIGGFAIFALLISSPLIADKMKFKSLFPADKVVEMVAPPIEDVKKPDIPKKLPPPPPPVKKIAMVKFTPPQVTIEAEKEPPLIVPPTDSTALIGNKTVEGEKPTAYVPPSVPVTADVPPPPEPKDTKPVDEDKPFITVEQNPEFPNGVKAMYQFLGANIKYPAPARENNIEGTVYVGFVVGRDGTIRDVVVKRGIGGGCNEEAVRVVQLMPKWHPGRQNGKAVSVAYTIPIKFALQ